MMTIAEKLQIIAENEEKVYHAGYIRGVNSVPTNGKRFTTGTVTFTTTQTNQIVTHNLGVIPSCVMLYPKDMSIIPPNASEEAKGGAYKFVHSYNNSKDISIGITYQGNTSTGKYSWQPAVGNAVTSSADETTFKTGSSGTGYKFPADIEFEWIAIE